MAKCCALTVAIRQAFRETLSPRERLRVIMRVNEVLGADMPGFSATELLAAREKWASELPGMLSG